ncbi:D-alanyl-D-alanine carboxypeptidase/D-alanyl-D-alanine-endopeptidase [Candidatus Sumerlaeota bacterium]
MRRSLRIATAVLLAGLLLAILPADRAQAASTKERFEKSVNDILKKYSRRNTEWGIAIRRASSGSSLYEKKSLRLLIPASNRKVFTSVLALEKMGPLYRYRTSLYFDGPVNERGHLHGNIRIVGTGDPTFANPRFHNGSMNGTLKAWANKVREEGVRYIHGDVALDCSAFVPSYTSVKGLPSDHTVSYAARPSCLAINENCVALRIKPGSATGRPAVITQYPSSAGIRIVNKTTTGRSRSVNTLNLERAFDTDTITVSGRVPLKARSESRLVTLRSPPKMMGRIFKSYLKEAGVHVDGEVKVFYHYSAKGSRQVTFSDSPPLAEILKAVNRESNNVIAEQIYQSVSYRITGKGSYTRTRAIEREFLDKIGVRIKDVLTEDGSGLSRDNRCTADSLVRLLMYERGRPHFKTFRDSLALSGKRGTLRNRMGTKRLIGRVYAKTGSLNGVACLSGYYVTPQGTYYVFSILANNTTSASTINVQGKILDQLARHYGGT